MKTQMGMYIEATTADELRRRAWAAGVSIGDLADLCLRFALERMTPEAIGRWRASQMPTRGRLAGALTKNERLVLTAFDTLKAKQDGAWRFPLGDVASEAGLRLTDAFWALKALQRRGEVHGSELEEVDRWGRPLKSFWSLIAAMPEAERARAVKP